MRTRSPAATPPGPPSAQVHNAKSATSPARFAFAAASSARLRPRGALPSDSVDASRNSRAALEALLSSDVMSRVAACHRALAPALAPLLAAAVAAAMKAP